MYELSNLIYKVTHPENTKYFLAVKLNHKKKVIDHPTDSRYDDVIGGPIIDIKAETRTIELKGNTKMYSHVLQYTVVCNYFKKEWKKATAEDKKKFEIVIDTKDILDYKEEEFVLVPFTLPTKQYINPFL